MKKIKMTKKNIIISIVVLLIVSIFFGSCDEEIGYRQNKDNEEPKKTEKVTATVTAIKETPKKTSTPKETKNDEDKTKEPVKEKTSDDNIDIDKANIELVLNAFETGFQGIATVKYNEKNNSVDLTPIDPQVMVDIYEAKQGNQLCLTYWNDLVMSLTSTSRVSFCKGITICLVNSLNTEKMVLVIKDGVVLYNEVDKKG